MPWILFLLAFGCFAVLCLTKSFALGVVCMLLALVFLVAATLQLLSARIGNATRHVNMLSPEELRVLREQAQAERQRTAGNQPAGTDPSPPSASS